MTILVQQLFYLLARTRRPGPEARPRLQGSGGGRRSDQGSLPGGLQGDSDSILLITLFMFSSQGKYVVVYFYPLDFTFVCPTEIIAFSDRIKEFEAVNTAVLGKNTGL